MILTNALKSGSVMSNTLKTTDVIDNTTSTDTDKPLSANQGKLLRDDIDNISTDRWVWKLPGSIEFFEDEYFIFKLNSSYLDLKAVGSNKGTGWNVKRTVGSDTYSYYCDFANITTSAFYTIENDGTNITVYSTDYDDFTEIRLVVLGSVVGYKIEMYAGIIVLQRYLTTNASKITL